MGIKLSLSKKAVSNIHASEYCQSLKPRADTPSPAGGISNDLADVVRQPSQMLSCFI